jgi:cation diffusion facilitator CzcD-associated flavoprotein CzcO
VTDGLARVRPDGIVDGRGELHRVDTIVLATGFHVTDMRMASLTTGAGGRGLSDVWDGSPQAYRGTTVAGFPNVFFLVGPNTGLGHNSIVFMNATETSLPPLLVAARWRFSAPPVRARAGTRGPCARPRRVAGSRRR